MHRAACLLPLFLLAACGGFPRDSQDSSERAGQSMRVGLSHDPPFVELRPGQPPAGIEVALVAGFAREHGFEVEWVVRGHDALMQDVLDHRLHMVVGGHVADSPWTDSGWSREFVLRDQAGGFARRRLALPPGENAWQMKVDRYLHARDQAAR